MATKIFKTARVLYRVEKNENGTLDIYREYYQNRSVGLWQKDGRKFDNAGSLIIYAGGIDAMLEKCVDVEDIELQIDSMNEAYRMEVAARERMHAKYLSETKAAYHHLFDGQDVVEANAKSVYTLLRYLNTQNMGLWKLPKLNVGYQCNQYNCDGKTATTIKLDRPIKVEGEMGTMFQYGAPRGHLAGYERIVDWE